MRHELKIEQVISTDSNNWYFYIDIYRESFPHWEREPEETIMERVQQGQYLLFVGIEEQQVVGFYILDLVAELNYVILTFLAVTKSQRGKGYGSLLCQDAITRFKNDINVDWLFIEAKSRQAIFYSKLGFRKLSLDYRVPKFGKADSVIMHLMVINACEDIYYIQGDNLAQIIKFIFIEGYHLSENDERLSKQLSLIPEQVKLS